MRSIQRFRQRPVATLVSEAARRGMFHPFVQAGLVRATVNGREHTHQPRPTIFLGGPHTSYGDTLLAFGAVRGQVTAIVAGKVFKTPILKQAFSLGGFIPTGSGNDVVGQIAAALKNGGDAMAWPEGKCYTDSALHDFRTGVFIAARDAEALVVPFGQRNVSGWWPLDGRPHLRHKRLETNFGPAIDTLNYTDGDEGLRRLIAATRLQISKLSQTPLAEDTPRKSE